MVVNEREQFVLYYPPNDKFMKFDGFHVCVNWEDLGLAPEEGFIFPYEFAIKVLFECFDNDDLEVFSEKLTFVPFHRVIVNADADIHEEFYLDYENSFAFDFLNTGIMP